MTNLKHIKELVTTTLNAVTLGGDTAINLVFATGYQESKYTTLRQEGGPALSYFQIEPASYADICNRINMHIVEYKKILSYLNMPFFPADANALIGNMTLAIIICRLKYWLLPNPLPANTVNELSSFYKTYYNTSLGAATMDEVIKNFTIAMDT